MQFISGQSEVVNRTQCISIGIVNDVTTKPVEAFLVLLDKVTADNSVVEFSEGFSNATIHIHNAGTKSHAHLLEKIFHCYFAFQITCFNL